MLRQIKVPKRKATPSLRPLRGAKGQTCVGAFAWCAVELTARWRAPFRQLRRVSSRGMGAATPMLTPQPPRRRRSQQGWGSRTSKQPDSHSGHRCARPSLRSAWRLRPRVGAERSDGPCGCSAPLPLWMRRGAQGLADQGSRLSERSETERVRARPRQTRAPQVAPARSGGDADSGVALSLVPFFWRRERKGLACRATPGLRPQQRHTTQSAPTRKHYKINSYQRISH